MLRLVQTTTYTRRKKREDGKIWHGCEALINSDEELHPDCSAAVARHRKSKCLPKYLVRRRVSCKDQSDLPDDPEVKRRLFHELIRRRAKAMNSRRRSVVDYVRSNQGLAGRDVCIVSLIAARGYGIQRELPDWSARCCTIFAQTTPRICRHPLASWRLSAPRRSPSAATTCGSAQTRPDAGRDHRLVHHRRRTCVVTHPVTFRIPQPWVIQDPAWS